MSCEIASRRGAGSGSWSTGFHFGFLLYLHTCCLKSNDIDEADEGITDASMMAIAEHCSALRKLDLSFCQFMSDAGIIAVAKGCPLLESLELDDCEWITEEAVDIIREACPRLARLSSCFA